MIFTSYIYLVMMKSYTELFVFKTLSGQVWMLPNTATTLVAVCWGGGGGEEMTPIYNGTSLSLQILSSMEG